MSVSESWMENSMALISLPCNVKLECHRLYERESVNKINNYNKIIKNKKII